MAVTTQSENGSHEVVKKGFNFRAFASVGMCMSLLFLSVSGIMNHQLQFNTLTVDRHFWMSVHNMAALLFILFIVIHLVYNWRLLIHYVEKIQGIRIRKEAVLAILLVLVIVGMFSSHVFHIRQ